MAFALTDTGKQIHTGSWVCNLYACMDINTMQGEKIKIINKNGPVIIIEDDADDQLFLAEVFTKLDYPNQVKFFFSGEEALAFINQTDEPPFIILSDINMPKLNGFELRARLKTDEKLNIKCIPYLFFSTAIDQRAVIDAYSMSVQGFFIKQTSTMNWRERFTSSWNTGAGVLHQTTFETHRATTVAGKIQG